MGTEKGLHLTIHQLYSSGLLMQPTLMLLKWARVRGGKSPDLKVKPAKAWMMLWTL